MNELQIEERGPLYSVVMADGTQVADGEIRERDGEQVLFLEACLTPGSWAQVLALLRATGWIVLGDYQGLVPVWFFGRKKPG
jgi:hypothetical protein